MTDRPFAATAPVYVERVGLKARNANGLARFYETVLGLQRLDGEGSALRLGAGGRELLAIEPAPDAAPDDPHAAGLFHTAFLLPTRADLGRWLRFAAENRVPVPGASDHLVSEAVYLADPEGNGIEIYADRPANEWVWNNGAVAMSTERMDRAGVMAAGGAQAWDGAPPGTMVGHVHLRVGDAGHAADWWNGLGFQTVARYGDQAAFLSTGGYHHHIGANTWNSAGAGARDPQRAGLAWVELTGPGVREAATRTDPWGTAIRFRPVAA